MGYYQDVDGKAAATEQSSKDKLHQQAIRSIEWHVSKLNEALGGGVTFGYIGNLDSRFGDDRMWYIFLPHPGRAGTADDRIGGFKTNDTEGAWNLANQARGALQMAKYMKGQR